MAARYEPGPDDATTESLPAVSDATDQDIVDHRQPPEQPGAGEASSAPRWRTYTGRHRQAATPEPTRLGLSTAGMTVAIGVLGAALTIMHTNAGQSSAEPPAATPVVTSPAPATDPASPRTGVQPQRQPLSRGASRTPQATEAAPLTSAADLLPPSAGATAVDQAETSAAPTSQEPTVSNEPRSQPTTASGLSRTVSPNSLARQSRRTCPAAASTAAPDEATSAAASSDAEASAAPDAVASASATTCP